MNRKLFRFNTIIILLIILLYPFNTYIVKGEDEFTIFEEEVIGKSDDDKIMFETKYQSTFHVENPVDVSVVVDVSGSMLDIFNGQSLINQTKFAINTILEGLKGPVEVNPEAVNFSLITFGNADSSHTEILVDMTNDLQLVQDESKNIFAEYGRYTDIAAGLELAEDTLDLNDERLDIIILITDGQPSDIELAREKARELKDQGIHIYAIKVGDLQMNTY